jgi:hypothetical protein
MSDYKPGTVAIATVRGVKGVRVFRDDEDWHSVVTVQGCWFHPDSRVTDVKPLVVLDVDALDITPARLAVWFRELRSSYVSAGNAGKTRNALTALADQIEAQTKPLRIDEPTEPLAEVTAHTECVTRRRKFIRGYVGSPGLKARWVDGITSYGWSELIDPEDKP